MLHSLEELWKSAPPGKLSPLEQLRAVAFRDVHKDLDKPVTHGELAERLTLVGGGHPTKQAVQQLLT